MTSGDAPARLAAAARALFAPEVAVAALDPRPPQESLLPEEEPAVAKAVERRRREFAAGRAAARRAMAELGLGARAVPMGADRAPVWPEGVVGSISHTDTCCMAVAARVEDVRSLGLDVEPDTPLDPELWNEVCAPAEAAWLAAQPRARRGRLAKLVFSAKECAYKCRYPLARKLLGFQEARVRIDLEAERFDAVFDGELAGGWRGAYRREEGLLIVGMARR